VAERLGRRDRRAGNRVLPEWLARFEEGKFARSMVAAEYAHYKARTGRLVPLLKTARVKPFSLLNQMLDTSNTRFPAQQQRPAEQGQQVPSENPTLNGQYDKYFVDFRWLRERGSTPQALLKPKAECPRGDHGA